MHKKYHDRGLTILAVNSWGEDADTIRKFADEHDLNYTILLSGRQAARDWGVRSIPTNFYIDRDGKRVGKSTGFDDKDFAKMEEKIEKLLR